MTKRLTVEITVNGETVCETVEPRMLLSDFLRETLGLTGTHIGCEQGICGACTVSIDGASARSCLMFAVQANGRSIETVESLGKLDRLHRIQEAFRKHHALQCGFCTPGFLMTVKDILERLPLESEEEIRDALSGNICRCTGYDHIVKAVLELVQERNGGKL